MDALINFSVILVLLIPQIAQSALPRLPDSLSSSSSSINPEDDRIVGGLAAAEEQFPYQVSLHRKSPVNRENYHYCGGSIISKKCVLSAAHCLSGRRAKNVLIVVGGNVFNKTSSYTVSDIIVHEEYDSFKVLNDIAILKLDQPLEFNTFVNEIPLPGSFERTPENTECVVSGWGVTTEGGSLADTLRYVQLPIVSDQKCREAYGEPEIADSMICAGLETGGKDSCQGDSGGPIVCDGRLTGVVSWGYGCARPEYPGVYTEVSYFIDWIHKHGCSD